MKKKLITIAIVLLISGSIGLVLANNKAKIEKAAHPEKINAVIPVKVSDVKVDSFQTAFTVNGTTKSNKEVKIASEVQGKLVKLYVKNGDMVRVGQPIAELDAAVLRAQLGSIESSVRKSQLDLARYSKLLGMGGATKMQVESVELQIESLAAEKKQILDQIDHMRIRAPFSGRIENVNAELGSFVSYGTVIAELIDNSILKIEVYLSEQEAFRLKEGQEVTIQSPVLDSSRTATIGMLSNKADASGKFLAEIRLINDKENPLKAGLLTDVLFSSEQVVHGLSIPVSSLVAGTIEGKVFVAVDNQAVSRIIKTGVLTGNKIQVKEGLDQNDKVIVSGQLNLEDGTAISITQ